MSERAPEVVLARHGETEWSTQGRHTGRTDIPLTPAGEAQAAALPGMLGRWNFGLVLCSPLRRAQQTCALAGFRDRAHLRDDLMEWAYGDLEGHTLEEWHALHPGWDIWEQGCPGGETIEQVGDRADRVIAEISAAGVDTVVFAHGHLLRTLLVRWLGFPAKTARHFTMMTAAIGVLGRDRDDRVLEQWNVTGRPPGEGSSARI